MSWERQKATITAEPEEPSTMLWLMACLVAIITGVLLFVLHTNQFLGTLQKFNLWIVAGSPLFLWLVIICLRSWLYNHAMDKHQFESDEAEYAQQQWTNWAGCYLAVLYSRVILPAELTPARFIQSPAELEQSNALGRRIALPLGENVFSALLGGLEESLIQLCADLPFGVTLLTDASDPEDHLQKAFSAAWIQHFGLTLSAPFLTILNTRSFSSVEERIKTPTLDVELLLIHQMQGGDVYSDALAALLSADGRTRIAPPGPDRRASLKRLYLQQNWLSLLEQCDDMFARGASHLWLDLQWYIHHALLQTGKENYAAIIQYDLKGLLLRLPGLETLAFNDGTPFADEVTLSWIQQQVMECGERWAEEPSVTITAAPGDNDILSLEPEALQIADNEGTEVALTWLQARPSMQSDRSNWLLRLLMARVAEQTGKNDLALHLLAELDERATRLTLSQWEPELVFEVKARRLKLLRMKSAKTESDRVRLQPDMEHLLAGLIAIDAARAAVLCNPGSS